MLVQRIVQPPLLGGVEQRALARIEMQMPVVAVGSYQRTVGTDAGGQAAEAEPREQLQPLRGQAGGRLRRRQRLLHHDHVRLGRGIQVGQGIHVDFVVVVCGRWLVVLLVLLVRCYRQRSRQGFQNGFHHRLDLHCRRDRGSLHG